MVKNPTFPERELERVRKERVADLSRIADDATAIAGRASRALVYGPNSAYGRPITGTEASVSGITRDEVVTQFERHYGPRNATLLVVGDVSEEEVLSKAEAHLGDWHPGKVEAPPIPSEDGPARPATAAIYLARQAGSAAVGDQGGAPDCAPGRPRLLRADHAELRVRRAAHGKAVHEPAPGQGLQLRVLLVHRLAHRAVGAVCGGLRRDRGDQRIGDRDSQRVCRHTRGAPRVNGGVPGRTGRHPPGLPGAVRDQRPDTAATQQHRRLWAAGRLLLPRRRQHGRP